MKIFSVKFKKSIEKSSQFFCSTFPEYAFLGRSNVGKSSLINFIINSKKEAKVSSYPGSTKFINFFLINHKWYLIDLPGYGYSLQKNRKIEKKKLIIDYVFYRKNLVCLFLLIDCRIIIQKIDLDFIQKLKNYKIHFCIVFTKTDKINTRILDKNINFCKGKIEKNFFSIPKYFKVSVKKRYGREKIIQYIQSFNESFEKKTYREKLIIPNS
ncbi:GTP-binding protein [Blattabacterium sp. (Cryptocercus kyebangensis)]|uniref:ribosome biogenesis GTP-binding protein YihA/YsxC n=1 Tax=Blattabacterium sp. (Cryptocercus kyebangensis) TaxID=298656 RepID=UPI000D7C5986|nr:ribosome biogenesis GTP-binding protein YihA/YsxC [Blattabacterium sp. (Cryptocercus kyebangensis)]AWU43547.1 GTP-binding protein [Blattabacterium sp. (Cryptocercus kyebangensis)]